jgi:hypothetical protein
MKVKLTCSSMDAFAQRTLLLTMGSPSLKVALQLITLLGDELTEIQTSSTPSLSITDHPSSASPLRASLKPLKKWGKKGTTISKEDS